MCDCFKNELLRYFWIVCIGVVFVVWSGMFVGCNVIINKVVFNWVKMVLGVDEVNWIVKVWWVVDGNYWISLGVSVGIDMMFGWIEYEYGRNESERIRIGMEWNVLN